MKSDFIISELMSIVIGILSILIVYEFYVRKDGTLRKIMICLFLSKIWLYLGSAYLRYLNDGSMLPVYYRATLLAPMFITMLWLWGWIRLQKPK